MVVGLVGWGSEGLEACGFIPNIGLVQCATYPSWCWDGLCTQSCNKVGWRGWLSAGWPDKYSSSYQVQICASQDVSGWLRQGITWSTQCTWDVRAREITVWQIYKHLPKREQSLTSIRRSRVDFRRRTPLAEGGGIDEFCSWVKCNTTYKRFILVFSIVMCADKVTLVWGACFYITKKKGI